MASMMLLFDLVATQLQAEKSVVAEANFYRAYDTPRFRALEGRLQFDLVQIRCASSKDVILSRYLGRAQSGERHHGHLDVGDVSGVENLKRDLALGLKDRAWDPLDVDGDVIQVDTTYFEKFHYENLLREVRAYVGQD